MSTALVWLRRDLRLTDNPALHAACVAHAHVQPVYIHDPDEEGDWPPGAASQWWLHHSLTALSADLAAAGSRLVIRRGPTAESIATLLRETGAEVVYRNLEWTPAAGMRDALVDERISAAGAEVHTFNASLLHDPDTIRTGSDTPFRVFTPFWKRVRAAGLPDRPLPAPTPVATPEHVPAGLSVDELGLLPAIPWDTGLYETWTTGEAAALERLRRFVEGTLEQYPESRDVPATDGTAMLSPHLHFGEISPRQIVAATAGVAGGDARERFLAELGWREFAHHLLHHFPHTTSRPLDPRFERFPWRDPDGEAAADLRAWQSGTTGIPLVDAGMRQLWYTGWMHNRARMVVASFLTKNLRIHWLEGARWFWDTLVDADLANNTLGWQWTAGCGADAAPFFRIFNPVRQGERFDPEGAYVARWVPELARLPAKHIHAAWKAPAKALDAAGIRLGSDYPEPIADLAASRRTALTAFQDMRAAD